MRRFAVLTTLLAVALLAAALSASPTSATVLCKTATDPCTGGVYPKGTTIEASLKAGHSVLDSLIGKIECKSAIKGEVINAGGAVADVTGTITSWGISGCTTSTVQVLKNGAFTINSPKEGGGTLVLEGFETTVITFGLHCIFSGSASIPLKGGEMASATSGTSLTRTGGTSGAFCGSSAPWTADYTVTAPEPLYVAETAGPVLCKTATDPCTGGTYGNGTALEATLKTGTQFILNTEFGKVKCNESNLKGEVTGPGKGLLTSVTFGSCNCGVSTLSTGSYALKATGTNNGTIFTSGQSSTVWCLEYHCVFATNNTPVGEVVGGSPAVIVMNSTLPRTGGTSGSSCGSSGTVSAEYIVTSPDPLYVAKEPLSPTVLCKTATDPCTGGTYGKGTTIEASLKAGHSVLDSLIGKIECGSSIKGEVTGAGGGETVVTGAITSWSFSGCTTAVVQVLKNGAFTIKSPKEGGGTLVLEGFETTVETFGLHCIFSGPVSIPLKGGEMASISPGSTVTRTGGRSGAWCGSSAPWTVDYTVTAPEPLWVAET